MADTQKPMEHETKKQGGCLDTELRMDDGVTTEDKSMEIPVLPSPRVNLQITTISLISSSCHRPIIEQPENLKGSL